MKLCSYNGQSFLRLYACPSVLPHKSAIWCHTNVHTNVHTKMMSHKVPYDVTQKCQSFLRLYACPSVLSHKSAISHTHIHRHRRTCLHAHIHTGIHACLHARTHTLKHTKTHIQERGWPAYVSQCRTAFKPEQRLAKHTYTYAGNTHMHRYTHAQIQTRTHTYTQERGWPAYVNQCGTAFKPEQRPATPQW